ncbi:MAG: PEP-CTERM sorting domain-containing protein [Phycisphaeraceae bacterium]
MVNDCNGGASRVGRMVLWSVGAVGLALALVASAQPAGAAVIGIANYRDDFQGTTFPSNWQYLWNQHGAIGDSANYEPLLWYAAGGRWQTGMGNLPTGPGGWLMLDAGGGHPGATGSPRRMAIAGYTVTEAGTYGIADGFLTNGDASGGDGVGLHVHVNNSQRYATGGVNGGTIDFDLFLGELAVGDVIYLMADPQGTIFNDSFNWDFTVTLIPEPASAALLGLGGLLLMRRRSAAGA